MNAKHAMCATAADTLPTHACVTIEQPAISKAIFSRNVSILFIALYERSAIEIVSIRDRHALSPTIKIALPYNEKWQLNHILQSPADYIIDFTSAMD